MSHKDFNNILKESGTNRKELAENIGLKYSSVNNQLAPSKELPTWAKSVVFINQKQNDNRKKKESETDQG